jgi:hypothetical protein
MLIIADDTNMPVGWQFHYQPNPKLGLSAPNLGEREAAILQDLALWECVSQ